MNDAKFINLIIEMLRQLYMFRHTTDRSDKRILRDAIRAIAKELTMV